MSKRNRIRTAKDFTLRIRWAGSLMEQLMCGCHGYRKYSRKDDSMRRFSGMKVSALIFIVKLTLLESIDSQDLTQGFGL